jgi:hypothetical protein
MDGTIKGIYNMNKNNIYLIAHYSVKPKNPAKTHIPGYMKDPANIRYDEQVHISTRLRSKDISGAKIIINLSAKQVQTNSFNGKKDFDELFKYFFKGYHKYITEVMIKLDAEYFNQMLDEMQSELDNEKIQAE